MVFLDFGIKQDPLYFLNNIRREDHFNLILFDQIKNFAGIGFRLDETACKKVGINNYLHIKSYP